MKTVFSTIEKFHYQKIEEIKNPDPTKIGSFGGLKLGDGKISFEKYTSLRKKVLDFEKEKDKIAPFFDKNVIFLQKDYAINLFTKTGHYVFGNLTPNGHTWAHVPMELKSSSFLGILSGLLTFAGFLGVGAFFGLSWVYTSDRFSFLGLSLISFVVFIVSFLGLVENLGTISFKKIKKFMSKNKNKEDLLREIFPGNKDCLPGLGNFRLKIEFPNPDMVQKEIQKVLSECLEIPNAKPLIIAHPKSIGISMDAKEWFKSLNNDPFIGVQIGDVVAIFPGTVWGNIEEEENLLFEIHKLFIKEDAGLFSKNDFKTFIFELN